ncbi:unnamed protein product [Discosporangium mesarthrocarpum]
MAPSKIMSNKVWVTEPHDEIELKVGVEGITAEEPKTVMDHFRAAVEERGDMPALNFKEVRPGESADDVPYTTLSWSQYYMQTLRFAKSLMSLGFAPHRCTNIIGFNSKEWFIANMGAIAAGGIAAGIYTSNLPDACAYITNHSEAEVVVLDGKAQLDKYLKVEGQLKTVKALVIYNDVVPEGLKSKVPVYTFEDFLELGSGVPDSGVEERLAGLKPGHCCSLIYTSGTTGPPKAVMISHDNVTWTTKALMKQFPFDWSERTVSYLPLSHIAAQILDVHGPMLLQSQVFFAQPDALKGSLVKTLREVRPTIFFGVPRVWEKMYEKMMAVGRSITGITKKISTWAKTKGLENARMAQYGGGGGQPCGFMIANTLAFSKVKQNLGLDQTKCLFTAAAPISVEILEYFASLNMHIYELFGQSECTGPQTVNTPSAWKIGSVGRPIEGSESKLDSETGELCYRGRHIFMGYMHNPEKTAETIDEDGWMHSGDVATFDEDGDGTTPPPNGFMKITGRIKELIITAGGENIPPVLIENEFKKEMPFITHCMVIGDKRKFLSIIICLNVETDDEGVPTDKLAGEALSTSKDIGSTATTTGEVATDEKWNALIEKGRKVCNSRTTSKAQVVQKWVIIPSDFSEKGGELTPTLKLKRGPTNNKYSDLIESMYS